MHEGGNEIGDTVGRHPPRGTKEPEGGDGQAREIEDRRRQATDTLRELFVVEGVAPRAYLAQLLTQPPLAGDGLRVNAASSLAAR